MPIGSELPTKHTFVGDEPWYRNWQFKFVMALVVIMGVPFFGAVIHRALETPSQRAEEDRRSVAALQEREAQQRRDAEQQQLKDQMAERESAANEAAIQRHSWVTYSIVAAEDRIKASLKDPDSVRFDRFWIEYQRTFEPDVPGVACGFVNAKNSFGGYTGYKRFIVSSGGALEDDGSPAFLKMWNPVCAAGAP